MVPFFNNVQLVSIFLHFAILFELKLAAIIKQLRHAEKSFVSLFIEIISSHSEMSTIKDVSKMSKKNLNLT